MAQKDRCCCYDEAGCCWDECPAESPPNNCIEGVPNSKWEYNDTLGYHQAKIEITGTKIQKWNVYFDFVIIYIIIIFEN